MFKYKSSKLKRTFKVQCFTRLYRVAKDITRQLEQQHTNNLHLHLTKEDYVQKVSLCTSETGHHDGFDFLLSMTALRV